jgi:hypothetical protein
MLSIVSLDNIARPRPGDHTIEAAITKWAIAALGALLVAVTLLPWYSAHNDGGSAQMAGWGVWTTTGEIDASLRPMPLALLVYLPTGVMVYGALRGAFGIAVIGAMATFVAGLLPFMLEPAVDRHAPGGSAVAVDAATAPQLVVAVALIASIACWIGFARCVLRPAPREEA